MEYILPIAFVVLVFIEAGFLIIGIFKKENILRSNVIISKRFLSKNAQNEKESFNTFSAISFCVILVLILKAAQLLLAFLVTGQDPFLQSTWERATDIPHYIDIAKDGYVTTGENSKWIVFFPLYPYILKLFGLITGEYYHTGCILSMIFFAAALFIFYKDSFWQYNKLVARRSVVFCCLCPSSFFAMLPMSEGLFMLLCACFLYFLHKKHFFISAIFGFLAALTRSSGVMLILPLAIALFKEYRFSLKLFVKGIPYAITIAFGTIIYFAINYHLFGDPLYFSAVQKSYWHQSLGFFGSTMKTLTHYALTSNFPQNIVLWLPQIVTGFFTLAIMLFTIKRSPVDGGFSLSLFVFSFSATWLLSAPRYMLPIFPCYNDVALLSKKNNGIYYAFIVIYALSSVYLLIGFLLTANVY